MNLTNLQKALAGEPAFRLKQAQKAVFQDLIEDWNEATVFSFALKKKLSENCPLEIKAETLVADDKKTVKALITLQDNLKIETVLMRYPGRNTVCVSSEVGCPLGCSFCLTGKQGFKRNLETEEIVEQVLFFNRYLKRSGERVGSLVFMGMGEPFLNYDSVLGAIRILNDKDAFNIGARHISISTVGVLAGIKKLSQEALQVNLALSLHAPNDGLRTEIMPVNRSYPLEQILAAVEDYIKKTRRKVMFEYIMIKGLNDSLILAQELALLLGRFSGLPHLVNLIAYNPTGIFEPAGKEQIGKFREVLESQGIEVTERYRFGRGIKAACGQLTTRS